MSFIRVKTVKSSELSLFFLYCDFKHNFIFNLPFNQTLYEPEHKLMEMYTFLSVEALKCEDVSFTMLH